MIIMIIKICKKKKLLLIRYLIARSVVKNLKYIEIIISNTCPMVLGVKLNVSILLVLILILSAVKVLGIERY